MANRPLKCGECRTPLYLPYPNATSPVDFDNPIFLTVEQMFLAELVCPLATCPSQGLIQEPFDLIAPRPLQVPQPSEVPQPLVPQPLASQPPVVPQPSEHFGYIFTLNPDVNRHQQQAQVLQQLQENDPEFDVPVHEGPPPCRHCVQSGSTCHGLEDDEEERCRACASADRPCVKSLYKVKPRRFWARTVIFSYWAPCDIQASGLRPGPDSRVILQYLVKFPWQHHHTWQPAAGLLECPWVVEAFHLNNDPNFPGPPEWLHGYEELSCLLAERRAGQGPGQI